MTVSREVLLSLTSHSDQFGTDVCEKRVRDSVPDTQEDTDVVLVDVVSEGTWLCAESKDEDLRHGLVLGLALLTFPVSEADPVVSGTTSQVEDDTEKQKADQNQDLAGTHPEFDLTCSELCQNPDYRPRLLYLPKNATPRMLMAMITMMMIELFIWWQNEPKGGNSLSAGTHHHTAALIFFSGSQNWMTTTLATEESG